MPSQGSRCADHRRNASSPVLAAGEPPAGPWRAESIADRLTRLGVPGTGTVPRSGPTSRPRIIALDGRGGAGKTTPAQRLASTVPASAIMHTDDVAWHHSFFDWAPLLHGGVLAPLHVGQRVSYRPPGGELRRRPGAIEVPEGLDVVWLEGTGSLRHELADFLDAGIWIQSDAIEAERRLSARDGDGDEERQFRREWDREEIPFLLEQRPLQHATVIVAGTPTIGHDPSSEVVTAPPMIVEAAHARKGGPG